MGNNVIPETELIYGLRNGDVKAFTAIYKLYFQRLYVYSLQFTKSEKDAEDIVQEVFVKLWTIRHTITAKHTLRTLLFIIARNFLINAYRQTINSPVFEDYIEYRNSITTHDHSPLEYDEFLNCLEQCLNELPPAQENVVRMSRFQHLSNKEISAHLNINEQSVKNHLSRGLKTIRSRLKELLTLIMLISCH